MLKIENSIDYDDKLRLCAVHFNEFPLCFLFNTYRVCLINLIGYVAIYTFYIL